MPRVEGLEAIVEDLIVALTDEAKEVEKLVAHVEKVTAHLPHENLMPLVVSQLSGLHHRIKKRRAALESSREE